MSAVAPVNRYSNYYERGDVTLLSVGATGISAGICGLANLPIFNPEQALETTVRHQLTRITKSVSKL